MMWARRCKCRLSASSEAVTSGSAGVELLKSYLNSNSANALVKKLVLADKKLLDEYERINFWTGGNFVINDSKCTGIIEEGLVFSADCTVKVLFVSISIKYRFPHLPSYYPYRGSLQRAT
jgi:hypothetical protein